MAQIAGDGQWLCVWIINFSVPQLINEEILKIQREKQNELKLIIPNGGSEKDNKVKIKHLVFMMIAAGVSFPATVLAAGESSISIGYAQSKIKDVDDHPKGVNAKYRYEFDDLWGIIGSFTYTNLSYDYYDGGDKVGDSDFDYYSLTAGPSYRFNDYVSVYGLLGLAHGKIKSSAYSRYYEAEGDESKTSVAYGVGLQVNPWPNWIIDASYEYSKLDDAKIGTWVIGAGYRF